MSTCLTSDRGKLQAFRGGKRRGGCARLVEWVSNGIVKDGGVVRDVRRREKKEAEEGAVGEPEVMEGIDVPSMQAEEQSVEQVAQLRPRDMGVIQISNEVHEPDMQATVLEQERRRKGKGLVVDEAVGPNVATRLLWPTNLSGEESCDPLDCNMGLGLAKPMDSDEADSVAGPVIGPYPSPIQAQLLSQAQKLCLVENVGETEGMKQKGGEDEVIEEAAKEVGAKMGAEEMGETVGREDKKRREEEGVAGGRARAGSRARSSLVSVPPGFQRIAKAKGKSSLGVASPFGKLQQGAFKHLRRPNSSGAPKAAKSGISAPLSMACPIASLQEKDLEEVARNVGIKFPPLSSSNRLPQRAGE